MEFVIVTGLSGSGKSSAVNVLEDIGFFCIDNMPPQLIPPFAEICKGNADMSKVAIVTDIRGGSLFLKLNDNIDELKKNGYEVKVLFLTANEEVIKKRYKETRRRHPLCDLADGDIERAIDAEIELLMPVKVKADYFLDTTYLSMAQLKENILSFFMENISDSILINCFSFGFKYGVPDQADLVFDVRCLPNPYYVPELKHLTGKETSVQDYVMNSEKSVILEQKLYDLVDFLLPEYIAEGKSQLVIAFGCTGGKHRSVTFAERIFEHLKSRNYNVRVLHRDINK